ncbi:MAG: extracellular solute-binding protein, partial [Chloroflexi bacterium]|nr:extracellular solute-binding protein [Chloroflexota bacterium]
IFQGYIDDNKFSQFGNQMLSFPFTKSVLLAYYNTDLMSAAGISQIPTTWDQFSTDMKAMQDYAKKQGIPWTSAYALNDGASNVDFEIMSRGGQLITDDQKKSLFNNDAAVAALQMNADLMKYGASYLPNGFDWENDLAAQKTIARMDSSTSYAFIDPLIAKAPKPFKYTAAAPPTDGTHKVTVMYGANIAIFKTTPQKQEAAWEFIKWFTDTAQTAQWSIKTHYLPIRQSAAKSADYSAALAQSQPLKAAFDSLAIAKPEPPASGWQQVRDILQQTMDAVVSGKAQPKQALDDAQKKADAALAG